jgi:hypothetical protein
MFDKYLDDYISGEKFAKIADFVNGEELYCDIENRELKSINNIFYNDEEFIIIYSRPNYINLIVDFLLNNKIENKIKLITHNSDYNIRHFNNIFYKQYSQNVDVISDNIQSIPIGLENSYNFPDLRKIEKMKNILKENKKSNNMLYINHDVNTNFSERGGIYNLFEGKYFSTVEKGRNGVDFDNYLYNIYNHDFVICPVGNGIDTHRTWECLYLGTIPIEKRNNNNRYYEGHLPICFVDSWEEVTIDFLKSEYDRIKSTEWNLDMLNFEYWKNKILNND